MSFVEINENYLTQNGMLKNLQVPTSQSAR